MTPQPSSLGAGASASRPEARPNALSCSRNASPDGANARRLHPRAKYHSERQRHFLAGFWKASGSK
jgi:hypothetical protein